MQYLAIPCNTMQYHTIPCNTLQYRASLITADGPYHSCGQYKAILLCTICETGIRKYKDKRRWQREVEESGRRMSKFWQIQIVDKSEPPENDKSGRELTADWSSSLLHHFIVLLRRNNNDSRPHNDITGCGMVLMEPAWVMVRLRMWVG